MTVVKRLHEHVFGWSGIRRLRGPLVEQIDVNLSDLIQAAIISTSFLSNHSFARPFKICDISFTRCSTPFLSSSVSLSNLRASSCRNLSGCQRTWFCLTAFFQSPPACSEYFSVYVFINLRMLSSDISSSNPEGVGQGISSRRQSKSKSRSASAGTGRNATK